MTGAPQIEAFDHVHVFVRDRAAAVAWYERVVGLRVVDELAGWADGGPLTLGNRSGSVHIALFDRPGPSSRSTIALRVPGHAFGAWLAHLREHVDDVSVEDHDLSVSLYFADPDGNPYEITTYDHEVAREHVG